MSKKETETQIERTPQAQDMIDPFSKFYKDLSDEIIYLIEEIKYEVQWLEQFCPKIIESESRLRSLMEFKNRMEKTRNELRVQSYSLAYGSDYTRYVYGEITEDEFMKIIED